MTDWNALIAAKLEANANKLYHRPEWRIDESVLATIKPDANISVLDIPRQSGLLTEQELDLTENYDATALLGLLASGKASSYDVTFAFCKRATIAHQLTNCLTEILFEEALERATALDEQFKKTGKTAGPLHGLPVSLKDSFNVKGVQSLIGYVSFLKHPPATKESTLVEILRELGAVIYCKTNIPQAMMTLDSHNHVFGRTLNPNKLCLTAGGSAGGEGALVRMRGSILSVCTDIAGSVRVPSLCNGNYGLKPTSERIPFRGKKPPGRNGSPSAIFPVIGPQGRSIRDLELFMQTVIDTDPWLLDHTVHSVPWRKVDRPSGSLRFGFILEDPKRPLHPTALRVMSEAKELLKKAGHEIVDIGVGDGSSNSVPSLYDSGVLAWKFFLLDTQKTPIKYIQDGEEPVIASLLACSFPENKDWSPTLEGLFDITIQRNEILDIYRGLWAGEFAGGVSQQRLDAIILPPYQSTAPRHDLFGVPIYTVLANLLDYPSVSIPFRKADKAQDEAFVRAGVNYIPPYDADAAEGAPYGIQVIGRTMKDEELLKVAEVIDDVLRAAES